MQEKFNKSESQLKIARGHIKTYNPLNLKLPDWSRTNTEAKARERALAQLRARTDAAARSACPGSCYWQRTAALNG